MNGGTTVEIAHTVTWDDGKRRRAAGLLAALAILFLASPVAGPGEGLGKLISVIVRDAPAAGEMPERFIEDVGGDVLHRFAVLDGFSAVVPEREITRLATMPGVLSVSRDARVHLLGKSGSGDSGSIDEGDLGVLSSLIGVDRVWSELGLTGQGIDVALIDSGVSPVAGLSNTGQVLNGPDLSFESQIPELRSLDTYGHGTHLAAIIAGRDTGASLKRGSWGSGKFVGIAPEARLVSLKLANARGATDVSQVIAAIDWVVQNRNKNGLNIRVLNLSFGTNPEQSYVLDPLSYAAEVAWRHGIFVVVAGGNSGNTNGQLNNPAYNPRVMAVGADQTFGTADIRDDIIPTWSSRGDGLRKPDLVAPGKSVKSLRVTGSYIDEQYPAAVVESRFFRGSGTSQSAAIVSGAAALLLQQRPGLSPDQLKKLFTSTAAKLTGTDPMGQGAGLIDVRAATAAATPSDSTAAQGYTPATGLGTLEGARGGAHVEMDDVVLQGERDIFGNSFSTAVWAPLALSGASWSGGTWNGASWSGASWSGATWSGASWSGASWSGATWSGASWSGASWSSALWA